MTPTVLVTGATGKQGFATARHLLAARAQVHALVRNPSSPASLELAQLGAKICPGTFDDLDSLKVVATGTTAVFLNVMPTLKEPELELHHAKNIIQAARMKWVTNGFWGSEEVPYQAHYFRWISSARKGTCSQNVWLGAMYMHLDIYTYITFQNPYLHITLYGNVTKHQTPMLKLISRRNSCLTGISSLVSIPE